MNHDATMNDSIRSTLNTVGICYESRKVILIHEWRRHHYTGGPNDLDKTNKDLVPVNHPPRIVGLPIFSSLLISCCAAAE